MLTGLLPLFCTEVIFTVKVSCGNASMVTVVRLRPLTVLRRFPLAVMSTRTTRCPGAWWSLNENRRVSVQAAGTAVGGGAVVAVDCVDVADELVLLLELPLEPLDGPGGGGGAWQSILLAFAGSLQSIVVARAPLSSG